jgi:hypothetical protein
MTTEESLPVRDEDYNRPAAVDEQVWYRVSTEDMAHVPFSLGAEQGRQYPARITHVHTPDTVNLSVQFAGRSEFLFTARPRGAGQGEWCRARDAASGAADFGNRRNTPERVAAEVDQRASAGEQLGYHQQTLDAPHEDSETEDGQPLTRNTQTDADRLLRGGNSVVAADTTPRVTTTHPSELAREQPKDAE